MLNLSHAVVTKRNTAEWENAIWELYDSDRFAGAATDARLNIVQYGMVQSCREFYPISRLRNSVTIKNKNVLTCVFASSIR